MSRGCVPLLCIGMDALYIINDMVGDKALSMVCILLNEMMHLRNIRVRDATQCTYYGTMCSACTKS